MKEQIIDILKKFWFVILVGVIFISFAIFFAWDTNKDKIPGKSVDGKDVIFSSDDYNYTANAYYNSLFNTESDGTKNGINTLYTIFQKEVLEESVETTDKMESEAEETFTQYEEYYKQTYGDSYETLIGNQLKQAGYNGIEEFDEFFVNQLRYNYLIYNYVKDNSKIWDKIYESEQPRTISHILVKCEDPNNPTDAEKAKMEKVEKALKKGTKFSKVAQQYSDDTTASVGGDLGMQLKSGSLVEAFKTAAWNLKEGETSKTWVKTEYGYHMIQVTSTDKKKLLKDEDNVSTIASAASTTNSNIFNEALWDAAKKLDVKFKDKDTKAELLKYMGIEEEAK